MSELDSPTKLTDAEFNLFEIETKTKKLVYELLQPCMKRADEDRDLLNEVAKTIRVQHEDRIEQLEYALFKSDETPTIFDDIDKKIFDVDLDRKKHCEDLN